MMFENMFENNNLATLLILVLPFKHEYTPAMSDWFFVCHSINLYIKQFDELVIALFNSFKIKLWLNVELSCKQANIRISILVVFYLHMFISLGLIFSLFSMFRKGIVKLRSQPFEYAQSIAVQELSTELLEVLGKLLENMLMTLVQLGDKETQSVANFANLQRIQIRTFTFT